MGRRIYGKFCKLLCFALIVWLISRKFGIELINWPGVESVMIAAMPSVIIFLAIVYIIASVFKK